MKPRITVVSLWAEEPSATAHFYRDVIGLHPLSHHGDRPHFDLDGALLTILKGRPSPARDSEPPRFPVVAFAVDSLDALVARLHAHRIDLPWGIEQDGYTRWVMFHDPAGNLIELVEFTS